MYLMWYVYSWYGILNNRHVNTDCVTDNITRNISILLAIQWMMSLWGDIESDHIMCWCSVKLLPCNNLVNEFKSLLTNLKDWPLKMTDGKGHLITNTPTNTAKSPLKSPFLHVCISLETLYLDHPTFWLPSEGNFSRVSLCYAILNSSAN